MRKSILSVVVLTIITIIASCSEWDTNAVGTQFHPANSQVRNFTHLVYVAYTVDGISVWGPDVADVQADIDGNHIVITNESDSLALFVYGYAAALDSTATSNGSITIHSSHPFALYLDGLSLRSQQDNVIESTSACHIVLPSGAKNTLYGAVKVDGHLTLSGTGSLTIKSQSSCITATSLQCQYGVNVDLRSYAGDGITLTNGSMRSTQGKWYINAAQNGICATDSIVLTGGTYQGTALDGSFLDSQRGAMLRCPTLIAASMWGNYVVDSLLVAQHYDSVQSVWQEQVDTLNLMADSTYTIRRNRLTSSAAKFCPRQSLNGPYVLICNSTILASDTLHFSR